MYTLFCKDFYKVGHVHQYPEGTELIFSNFTPRKSLMNGVNHSVFFGLRYFIDKYLMDGFNDFFYRYDENAIHKYYKKKMNAWLGNTDNYKHIQELCLYKTLPLKIYALPELSVVPCGVPALVMFNTDPRFYWLPNMLETIMSCTLWGPCTSATIAREYRILLDQYALETSDNTDFVDYQAHDFSMRGMYGLEAAMMSGAAHLQYFKGTDVMPAMSFLKEYYGIDDEFPCSIAATEHSVMSAGGRETELETFDRLITKVYPSEPVSIVSDTWDLWNVICNILPILKDKIMNRDGKVVIRPDSGDPVKIICGYNDFIEIGMPENKEDAKYLGVIECLWHLFGGKINSKGYRELDPHIGAIYGDSITIDRAREICERLKQKGFASTNIVFGVGSYTYQYNTRDTLGWAMKSTYCEINGKGYPITKDPVTDNGTKKSHSGILKVIKNENGKFEVKQNCTWDEFYQDDNELKLVFNEGVTINRKIEGKMQ